MRISTGLVLTALIIRTGVAAPTRVTICTEGVADAPTVSRAELQASEIFSGIGIRSEWRTAGAHCPPNAILITFSDRTPQDFHRGAFAFAMPYEGSHIRIFYDRIATRDILAHVLVHEITHILQGVTRHSDEGMMKAVWSGKDYSLMYRRQLKFTPLDIQLIQAGLAARQGLT